MRYAPWVAVMILGLAAGCDDSADDDEATGGGDVGGGGAGTTSSGTTSSGTSSGIGGSGAGVRRRRRRTGRRRRIRAGIGIRRAAAAREAGERGNGQQETNRGGRHGRHSIGQIRR